MDFLNLPLHPMLVHFPIALFIIALVAEVLSRITKIESLHHCAQYLYVLAAIVAPFVVLTGLREADELHLHHPVVELHEKFGLLTMWTSLVSLPILWLFKKKMARHFRLVFLIFLVLIVTSVVLGAHYGGRLVYEYGIGTESE